MGLSIVVKLYSLPHMETKRSGVDLMIPPPEVLKTYEKKKQSNDKKYDAPVILISEKNYKESIKFNPEIENQKGAFKVIFKVDSTSSITSNKHEIVIEISLEAKGYSGSTSTRRSKFSGFGLDVNKFFKDTHDDQSEGMNNQISYGIKKPRTML